VFLSHQIDDDDDDDDDDESVVTETEFTIVHHS